MINYNKLIQSFDHRVKCTGWLTLLIMLLLLAHTSPTLQAVAQQPDSSSWSRPVLFFGVESGEDSGALGSPALLTDSGGNLHALWPASPAKDEPMILFYSRWDGVQWSNPIDILCSPDGSSVLPQLLFDKDDWLHAFWRSSGGIWHSQAHASALGDARNWSPPEQFFGDEPLSGEGQFSVLLDPEGGFHLAYSTGFTAIRYGLLGKDARTWLFRSTAYLERDPDTWVRGPRITRSPDGALWISWTELEPTFLSKGLRYVRSLDNGRTWSDPNVIIQGYYSGRLVAGREVLFRLVAGGGGTGGRYVSISRDNGETWTAEVNISASGNTGEGMQSIEIAQDGAGVWHFFEQTGLSFATVTWDGVRWSTPQFVISPDDLNKLTGPAQNGAMAISGGNQMHVFWQAGGPASNRQLWYTQRQLNAPSIEMHQVPTPIVAPTRTPPEPSATMGVPTPTATSIALSMRVEPVPGAANLSRGQSYPLVVALGAVLLLLVAVFLVQVSGLRK